MSKLVSIIIPSYNYGFIIEETLRNILAQSYQNWEVLIVDDGSTDNSREIIESFAKKDGRIKYFLQNNRGVSFARNHGFDNSKGDYIQFLDADDLLSKHKVSLQVDFLNQNPTVDISYSGHAYFENDRPEVMYPDYEMNNHDWLPRLDAAGYEIVNTLVYSNIAVVSSPLIRRAVVEKVGGFPEHSKYTEDWEFWFLCAINRAHFSFFDNPEAKTLIRIHTRNTSRNIQIMQAGELKFRKRMVDQIMNSYILTDGEKEKLLERNTKSTEILYKYMMYHCDLTSIEQLKIMAELTGWKTFVSYYFKSLNFKRKALFKNKR
jgi:glycosyltransferase involved in cell wall biosynthesis